MLFIRNDNKEAEYHDAEKPTYATDDTYCNQEDVKERAKCLFTIDRIPRVDISTKKALDLTYQVWNKDITVSIDNKKIGNAKIKTRGNTTYQAATIYGAYNYKLKFDEDVNIFGFGSNKKWVLLPNFIDRSYFRQFYFSNLGQLIMGDYFSPEMKYIELYINNQYKGLYLLSESIEEDENRLEGSDFIVQLEQGRLWRLERGSDKDYFQIDDKSLSCNINAKDPDVKPVNTMYTLEYPDSFKEAGEEKTNNIKSSINDLVNNARESKSLDSLDLNSAVNFYMFDELFYNSGFGSSSVYLYKLKDYRIILGPLWDFDQLGLSNSNSGFNRPPTCDNNLYRYLLTNSVFRKRLKEKLIWYKENLADYSIDVIEELRNNKVLRDAVYRNEQLYHTWGNPMKDLSVWQNSEIVKLKDWDEHLDFIENFMNGRADWILNHYGSLY